MGLFLWSHETNGALLAERGLCSEAVVAAIGAGALLDVLGHPNPDRYPVQRALVVQIGVYAVLDPFVIDPSCGFFLNKIIPRRKPTRANLPECTSRRIP